MKRKLEERVERELRRYKVVLGGGGKEREERIEVKRVVVDGRERDLIVIE